ncbi:TolC family outer membrane protein [Sphingomonas sp. VNH70]|uniref:TolC family outer membrane protein n=1 Tax=Sphingomonas silueang TaxID=3156617 RepID=UPI0032B3E167
MLLVAVPAHAQDTLVQAIADAYRTNPTLDAQRAQLRSLDETIVQAGAPYRPSVSLDMALQYRSADQRNLFDDFVTNRSRTMAATLSARQILLNGGRTAAQVSVAEARVLAGREALRQAENAVLFEVVDAYVAVRRDAELVAIQRRSLDSYGRQVAQAIARERGGDLTRTDIAQARAQAEIIRAQLAQSEATLQVSRARFATLVGRMPGELAAPPVLAGLPTSLDAAFAIAQRESPAIGQAMFAARAGDARIAAERAERAPVVALSGGYGYGRAGSFQTRDLGQQASGGVTLTMPLIAGGVIGSRIRAAQADRERLGYEVEGARRQALAATQDAWNQALAAAAAAESGRVASTAAQEALTGVQKGFAEGFRSNFEVLDSEQRLLNAQLVLVNATYAAYLAQARLLATLGRLQAAALGEGLPTYDAAANTVEARRAVIGPLDPLLSAIDRAQVPGSGFAPTPPLPVATAPVLRDATAPPPSGSLGTSVPILPTPVISDLNDTVVTG